MIGHQYVSERAAMDLRQSAEAVSDLLAKDARNYGSVEIRQAHEALRVAVERFDRR